MFLDLLSFFSSVWLRIMSTEGNVKFEFWGFHVKKFKFGGAKNQGHAWINWSVSQKSTKFGERSIFMKCSTLYRCLNSSIQFLIFENFYMVFR